MFSVLSSLYQPTSSSYLSLTLIALTDWVLVNVTGQDSQEYLQSQLTADLMELNENHHLMVAHCNLKGKVWSNLRLFRYGNGFSFIERRSIYRNQIAELKKYAVFSKVAFTLDDTRILLGVAGFEAQKSIAKLFNKIPNEKNSLINEEGTLILWFKHPVERFLIISNKQKAIEITKALHKKAKFNKNKQWLALDIEAGLPIIDFPNFGRFIPQAINLQVFGGISFKKGCYLGQEVVARATLQNKNRHTLQYLIGTANRVPDIGEKLEMQLDEKRWCYNGTVLASLRLKDKSIMVQAVIKNNIKSNSIFRIKGDINTLSIQLLPYSL